MATSNDDNLLAEVFGFPSGNHSEMAQRFRKSRLCPYNNKVPNCTKDKANDPLGVCSIYHQSEPVITCPIRFRQDWLIAEDASKFFFNDASNWTSLAEVRLLDKHGGSAGNIDIVLVSYDNEGQILDFGSLEIQAVYISGNVRAPFAQYMKDPLAWTGRGQALKTLDPRPDYLSSSRKRLIPQMLYKGGILKNWNKKQAVALQNTFYETLPPLPETNEKDAEIAWFLYKLEKQKDRFQLVKDKIVYTKYWDALNKIISPEPGDVESFVATLQRKLDEKLDNPPDAPLLFEFPTK